MRRTDQFLQYLQQVPMFQACSKKDLTTIGRLAEDVKVDPGQALVTEGARGDEFFIIIEGTAAVSRGGVRIASLGPGDYFGELALLDPAPRDATVTAETALEVLVLGKREFGGLLSEIPTISHKLMVGMARRLHEADNKALR